MEVVATLLDNTAIERDREYSKMGEKLTHLQGTAAIIPTKREGETSYSGVQEKPEIQIFMWNLSMLK